VTIPQSTERAVAPSGGKPTGLLALGGVTAALAALAAATSCCLLPLALVSVGVTGAWVGSLAALGPYQPLFAALALGFVGSGFWAVYRRPQAVCDTSSACARPESGRMVKSALWAATALAAMALGYPYVQPWLLGT
jgi:mercuric ion transport protein